MQSRPASALFGSRLTFLFTRNDMNFRFEPTVFEFRMVNVCNCKRELRVHAAATATSTAMIIIRVDV